MSEWALIFFVFVFKSHFLLIALTPYFLFQECTFIILDKQRWAGDVVEEEQCMLGDVNIFLTDPNDQTLAELEIMIAGGVSSVYHFC